MKLYFEPVVMNCSIAVGIIVAVFCAFNVDHSNEATVDHITPVPLQIGNQPIPRLPPVNKNQDNQQTPQMPPLPQSSYDFSKVNNKHINPKLANQMRSQLQGLQTGQIGSNN